MYTNIDVQWDDVPDPFGCDFCFTVDALYLLPMLVGDAHLSVLARASYTLQASV